jgi:hypothetical protein
MLLSGNDNTKDFKRIMKNIKTLPPFATHMLKKACKKNGQNFEETLKIIEKQIK